MKEILIISHHFPPYNHIASNRIEAMSKYLNNEKYNVNIITLYREDNRVSSSEVNLTSKDVHRVKNTSFFKKVNFSKPTNVVVHKMKAAYNKIHGKVFLDEFYQWTRDAIKLAEKMIVEKNIKVILTSYGPFSSLVVGYELKKKYPRLKWIIDMRDDYSNNKEVKIGSSSEFIEQVDGVISVSLPIIQNMKNRMVDRKPSIHYEEIRNGFDFETESPKRVINKKFNITYTGSFYGEINPKNFLKALSILVEEQLIKNFHVNFIGVSKPLDIPSNLKRYVTIERERIPYKENITRLKNSDLLLLILPRSEKKGVYSGKVFDYLGSMRPILALVPDDDVASKLIVKCRSGYTTENEDILEVKNTIIKAYEDWLNNEEFLPDIPLVKIHHREEQMRLLEKILDELV